MKKVMKKTASESVIKKNFLGILKKDISMINFLDICLCIHI